MACTKDSLLITRNYYFGPTGYGHFIEITEEMNQSRVTLFLYLHGCHKEASFFFMVNFLYQLRIVKFQSRS